MKNIHHIKEMQIKTSSILKYQISRYKNGIIVNSILPFSSWKNPPFSYVCLGFKTRWYKNK